MELSDEAIKKIKGMLEAKGNKEFSEKEVKDIVGQIDKISKEDGLSKAHFTKGFDFEKKVAEYFGKNEWGVETNINYDGGEIDLVATKKLWALQGSQDERLNIPFEIKLIISCKGLTSPTSIYFEKKDAGKVLDLVEEKLFFYGQLNRVYRGSIPPLHHYQDGNEIAHISINTDRKNEISEDFKQCLDYEKSLASKNGFHRNAIIYTVVLINPLNMLSKKEGEEMPPITENFQYVYKYDNGKYAIADVVLFDKVDDFSKIIDADVVKFRKALWEIHLQKEIDKGNRQERGRGRSYL